MAYDLLTKKQSSRNWAIQPASMGPGSFQDRPFSPEPLATTPAEQQMLARLAAVKMIADAGDKRGRAAWKRFVVKELPATRKLAKRGDMRAQRLLVVVQQSGLLSSVTAMTVSGGSRAAVNFSPKERELLLFLASVRKKEIAGDPRAIAFGRVVGSLSFGTGKVMA